MMAIGNHDINIVRLLIEQKANINQLNVKEKISPNFGCSTPA